MFSAVDRGVTNFIHDRCSCTLFTLPSVSSACLFTLGRFPVEANSVVWYYLYSQCQLGWMSLKREQTRRERESELRLVNSL